MRTMPPRIKTDLHSAGASIVINSTGMDRTENIFHRESGGKSDPWPINHMIYGNQGSVRVPTAARPCQKDRVSGSFL